MGIGDLVRWKRINGMKDYYDVGIILNIETNESPYAMFNLMIEVYFMRIGHLWVVPDYIEVVSRYSD